jgi:hypothetical protein
MVHHHSRGDIGRRESSLDPVTGATHAAGHLAAATYDAAGARLGGQLYLFGGGTTASVPTVQRMNHPPGVMGLSRRTWKLVAVAPRMPGPGGRQAMAIGPVEYLILGFPGNNFTGQIVPELAKLLDSGLVRIIDLTFITKDAAGRVDVVEYDAVEELAAFAGLDAEVGGILTDEDIAHAAMSLEPNTSAALLIWEDTWATPFAEAVRNANGVILEGARIPREIIEEVMDALADAVD